MLIKVVKSDKINISVVSNCKDETVKKSLLMLKNLNKTSDYITLNAKQAFTQLRQAFTNALIFQQFALKYFTQMKIDISSYAIRRVLN